jgi:hypothetical protein
MRFIMSCVLALVLGSLISAQTKPDFSGVWTRESGQAREDINLGGVVGGVPNMTITQDGSAITIERFWGNDKASLSVKLDGSETRFSIPSGPSGHGSDLTMSAKSSSATWDGGKLMLTTTVIMKDVKAGTEMTIVTKEALSLEGPTLVVDRTQPDSLGAVSVTKDIYKKRLALDSKQPLPTTAQ